MSFFFAHLFLDLFEGGGGAERVSLLAVLSIVTVILLFHLKENRVQHKARKHSSFSIYSFI